MPHACAPISMDACRASLKPGSSFVRYGSAITSFISFAASCGCRVTTSRDVLETLGTANQPSEVLVALGYASWEKGQLEQEILDNAWLTAPADMNILFKTPIADRWRDAAKLIGIDILTMPGVAGHA